MEFENVTNHIQKANVVSEIATRIEKSTPVNSIKSKVTLSKEQIAKLNNPQSVNGHLFKGI